MENHQSIEELNKSLRQKYGNSFTTFESLSLAIQIQRNQILKAGLNVQKDNKKPASLEAIAMQLGFDNQHHSSLLDVISYIGQSIEKKS